jgi:DNA polymerase-4
VPGVGKKNYSRLIGLGIKYLGDVKQYPESILENRVGRFGKRLWELSWGMDSNPVSPKIHHKSMSSEHTFHEDTCDEKLIKRSILRHAADVARQLRRYGFKARTITLKIKHADFKQSTRHTTIDVPTRSTRTVYQTAVQLFDDYHLKNRIRLIGVGVSNLISGDRPIQMGIFGAQTERNIEKCWDDVDKAVDAIEGKFGNGVIRRASLKTKPPS